MNIDYINIKTYLENKNENISLKAFWYSTIVGVLLILVIVFSCYQKKNLYYENILLIDNDKIILKINYQEIDKILANNKIIINGIEYNYRINNIQFNQDDYNYKVNIILNVKLLINNGILDYKIPFDEESILNYIVRVMKGD